jgi:Nucleotidyl transferase AbiEii toxin, Type IV TA system
VTLEARIAGARLSLQPEIGFGDVVVPTVQEIEYPSLLDLPTPKLRAYPPETVVAEKFQAMVRFGAITSRMKDFYDLGQRDHVRLRRSDPCGGNSSDVRAAPDIAACRNSRRPLARVRREPDKPIAMARFPRAYGDRDGPGTVPGRPRQDPGICAASDAVGRHRRALRRRVAAGRSLAQRRSSWKRSVAHRKCRLAKRWSRQTTSRDQFSLRRTHRVRRTADATGAGAGNPDRGARDAGGLIPAAIEPQSELAAAFLSHHVGDRMSDGGPA